VADCERPRLLEEADDKGGPGGSQPSTREREAVKTMGIKSGYARGSSSSQSRLLPSIPLNIAHVLIKLSGLSGLSRLSLAFVFSLF
jgi:hypothetical protein